MDAVFNLSPQDIPALKRFIAQQFHDKYILLNDDFFEWQYKANPFNFYPHFAMKIIKYKKEVLGFGGIVPVRMHTPDGQLIAGAFANVMVDSKVRAFGLGTLLVREILKDYQLCYISGYSDELQKLCLKLPNWTEMGNLKRMIAVIDEQTVKKLTNKKNDFTSVKKNKISKYKLKLVKEFSDNVELLWSRTKHSFSITIERSNEYLNWRYADHPLLSYQLFEYELNKKTCGYAVIRVEEFEYNHDKYRAGRIIDLVCDAYCEIDFFTDITSFFRKQKVDFIDFFYSGNQYTKTLQEIGFVDSTQHPYDSIPMLLNPVDENRKHINWITYCQGLGTNHNKYCDPANWYITKGDGDQDRPNIPRLAKL